MKRERSWALWTGLLACACGSTTADPLTVGTTAGTGGSSSAAGGGASSSATGGGAVEGVRLTTDLGVPCEESTDVTELVNQAIAGLAANSTLLLECFYRIDRPVIIEQRTDLRITKPPDAAVTDVGFIRYTQDTRPDDWPPKTPFFTYVHIGHSQRVVLDHFAIRGPLTEVSYDAEREFASGVLVQGGSQDITVSDLDIRGVHGDFFSTNEDDGLLPIDIVFENIYGEVAGRQMVGLAGNDRLTIRGSTFLGAARSGLDLEPANPLGVHNVTVEDSRFEDYRNFGFGAHANCHHLTIKNSTFIGGLGLAKAGIPAFDTTSPPNVGLVLENVVYDYAGSMTIDASLGSINVRATEEIDIVGADWTFNGGAGSIDGSGEVRDSVFRTDKMPGPSPVVCIGSGVLDSNNTGTGPCP